MTSGNNRSYTQVVQDIESTLDGLPNRIANAVTAALQGSQPAPMPAVESRRELSLGDQIRIVRPLDDNERVVYEGLVSGLVNIGEPPANDDVAEAARAAGIDVNVIGQIIESVTGERFEAIEARFDGFENGETILERIQRSREQLRGEFAEGLEDIDGRVTELDQRVTTGLAATNDRIAEVEENGGGVNTTNVFLVMVACALIGLIAGIMLGGFGWGLVGLGVGAGIGALLAFGMAAASDYTSNRDSNQPANAGRGNGTGNGHPNPDGVDRNNGHDDDEGDGGRNGNPTPAQAA